MSPSWHLPGSLPWHQSSCSQERATKISHGNTARLAHYHGDTALAKLCGLVAADEGRHEIAYSTIVGELFNRDPDGAMLAFADMMKKGIVMPAHFLDDGWVQGGKGCRPGGAANGGGCQGVGGGVALLRGCRGSGLRQGTAVGCAG